MRRWWLMLLVALPALAERDAGLVWSSLRPGWGASNAVHNAAQGGTVVGNTRGPIQSLDGGIASNGSATVAWVGLGTNYNPLAGATEATVMLWARLVNLSSALVLMSELLSTGATGSWQFTAVTATRLDWYIQQSGARYDGQSATVPSFQTTNWVHLAATWRTPTNTSVYVDGIEYRGGRFQAGAAFTAIPPSSVESRVGAYGNAGYTLINGNALWGGRMYHRALSSNEVYAAMMSDRRELPR